VAEAGVAADRLVVTPATTTPAPLTAQTPDVAGWYLYMVRCGDGTVYTGVATDVARRFADHTAQGRRCARYLRGRLPLHLAFVVSVGSRGDALRAEAAAKRLSRRAKEDLIAGRRALVARDRAHV
jgi:putative endonuclease